MSSGKLDVRMMVSFQGRAEVDFEVTEGVDISIRKHFTTQRDNPSQRYTLTVKVEGPRGAANAPIQGDAHAMLRNAITEAAEALLAALEEDDNV